MKKTRWEATFADVVADVRATPTPPVPQRPGRSGRHWVDPTGRRFDLVNGALSPDEAQRLAQQGAAVVYDSCGCGGTECRLDWLSADDVKALATGGSPTLHPSKQGLARLAQWQAEDGSVLIETAAEITWGQRIRG